MSSHIQHETRDVILQNAEKLIRTRGYAGFSYADLSALVGITKASIHYHFPTKEQLTLTTLQVYRDRYDEAFTQISINHTHALDRIEAYGRLYLDAHAQGDGCLCAALSVERDILPASLLKATAIFFEGHLSWLKRVYCDGLANGQVSAHLDAEDAAQIVLAVLEGSLIIERAMCRDDEMERLLKSIRAMFASREIR